MENKVINRLPFWETIARSFKYVFKNKALLKTLPLIVGGLTVLQIILGLPIICSINEQSCADNWQSHISMLAIILVSIGIIINYCRAIICKVNVDFISVKFWMQVGAYILASILLSVIILLPAFIGIVVGVSLLNSIGLANAASAAAILIPFAACIFFAPLFLVFPAIAAEDKELFSLPKLFAMAEGNHNAIFWAQFVIMIPYWLLSAMMTEIYAVIGIDNYALKLFFVIVILTLGILDACFKGAYFAHIYQFFKFYNQKK